MTVFWDMVVKMYKSVKNDWCGIMGARFDFKLWRCFRIHAKLSLYLHVLGEIKHFCAQIAKTCNIWVHLEWKIVFFSPKWEF